MANKSAIIFSILFFFIFVYFFLGSTTISKTNAEKKGKIVKDYNYIKGDIYRLN